MAITTAFVTVGKLIISFLFAAVIFYLIDQSDKKVKKQKLDEFFSLILQFVIYVWLAKIIMNLTTFIGHPIAILAYPSNAENFYLATLLWGLHFAIKYRKKQEMILPLLNIFLLGVLVTLFMFEFLTIMTDSFKTLDLYFILLAILNGTYILLYQKRDTAMLTLITFEIWLFSCFVFALGQGYFNVFQYFLHPTYFILVGVFLAAIYFYYRNKEQSWGQEK